MLGMRGEKGTKNWKPQEETSKIPGSKLQIPDNLQTPDPKHQLRGRPSHLEVWDLEFLWDLGFGIWDFSFSLFLRRKPPVKRRQADAQQLRRLLLVSARLGEGAIDVS